jgi:hypothetical protein
MTDQELLDKLDEIHEEEPDSLVWIDGFEGVIEIDDIVVDEDTMGLITLLADPIYGAELCWDDPENVEYSYCYRVRDYQYPLFRMEPGYGGAACSRKTGKALADTANVLTPDRGFIPIVELEVGDLVIGSDGRPTTVLGVYPQGVRDLYRVCLKDGSTVDCDGDHLWTLLRWGGRRETVRLKEMLDGKQHRLPLPSGPVEFEAEEVEQDPWLVGALLGDGGLSRPTMIRFSSEDEENIERVRKALPDDCELVWDGNYDYRIRSKEFVYATPGVRSAGRKPYELLEWTRSVGLQGKRSHEKHIPQEFLYASVEDRIALLRGLCDTDGSAGDCGSVDYSTASKDLAEGIRWLVLSLGGRVSMKGGRTTHRDRWRLSFRIPGVNPFLLSHKAERYEKRQLERVYDHDCRLINEITPIGRGRATCIEVSAEDGLFMTEDMVLTHNTESIKARGFTHGFRRLRENLLVSAPELIHLLPLTDAIEDRVRDCRLTREFLDTRGGKTGFTHRPFGCNYKDGTKVVGRIPKVTGPQPLDAGVLTPMGWTTMGEIAPGDEVLGPSGEPTRVLGVTNSWEAEVFEVELSDGSITRADAKHRWRVRTDSKDWHVQYTEDLAKALAGPQKRNGGKLNMFRVPQQLVVEFDSEGPPPLDPYVVGALLGDGAISGKHAQIISNDEELIARVRGSLPDGCGLTQTHPIKWLITGKGRGYQNPVLTALRDLGLLGHTAHTKFIPERYKRGSVAERLDVVRGLLDADGTVKDAGSAHLVSASKQLVADCAEVVRSLGGWASTGSESKVGVGTYHRATFRLKGEHLFWLTRKAAKEKLSGRVRHRSVRRVTSVGTDLVRCIKVAAHDEAYLTDDLIPTLNTGVKGQHQPDLMIDEAQDFPEAGWTEIHETVNKNRRDAYGEIDFNYHFYGVHSGARDSGFFERVESKAFYVINVTALMRPDWDKAQKDAAKAAYGSTDSPDYRRNILGEAGSPATAFFVLARLMACIDQDRESHYNTLEYVFQRHRFEDVEQMGLPVQELIDLPPVLGPTHGGMDLGLSESPTVISLFSRVKEGKVQRLKLMRRYQLDRFRPKQIRAVLFALATHLGSSLETFGIDITGLGFPIWQEIEDDESVPQHLLDVTRGYMFNAKVPVSVEEQFVNTDPAGNLKDQFGTMVVKERDPLTGEDRYVTYMPFIEASTRYLREDVNSGFLLLPFDKEVLRDMRGETDQRVRRVSQSIGRKKPQNAFHTLDSFRAMEMARKSVGIELALTAEPEPILDQALDLREPMMEMVDPYGY